MACAKTLTHIVGDTFYYAGRLAQKGVPVNLTGWQVYAYIRETDLAGDPLTGDPLSEAVVTVLDQTNTANHGAFTLRVADTTQWARSALHYLEVVFVAADATRTTLRQGIMTK